MVYGVWFFKVDICNPITTIIYRELSTAGQPLFLPGAARNIRRGGTGQAYSERSAVFSLRPDVGTLVKTKGYAPHVS